jgi:predicted nuclease with TOPRIM domain
VIGDYDPPEWVRTGMTLLLGAGGAKMLSVWLENRRLAKKEFRETLLERIRDLERQVAALHDRIGNQREVQAHLQERLDSEQATVNRLELENDELQARVQDLEEANSGLRDALARHMGGQG